MVMKSILKNWKGRALLSAVRREKVWKHSDRFLFQVTHVARLIPGKAFGPGLLAATSRNAHACGWTRCGLLTTRTEGAVRHLAKSVLELKRSGLVCSDSGRGLRSQTLV